MTEALKGDMLKELIDGLLTVYEVPEDLIDENGLLKQLEKMLFGNPPRG